MGSVNKLFWERVLTLKALLNFWLVFHKRLKRYPESIFIGTVSSQYLLSALIIWLNDFSLNWFMHSLERTTRNYTHCLPQPARKELTECEPEIQAYFPEKLFWWKNNQSESQTQNWQHFLSRCHTKKDKNQVFPL